MKSKLEFYPFVVGTAPVITLFASNLGEIGFAEVWRALLAVILLTSFFLLANWLVFSDGSKARLLTSVIMLSVLAYGHVYDTLKQTELLASLVRHRSLFALNVLFLLGFAWLLWKRIKNTGPLEIFFAWFCIFMIVFPVYRIGNYYLFSDIPVSDINTVSQNTSIVAQNKFKPDVYYIILDGYGREDTLQEFYDFDNSEFVNELNQLGFYVASEATSNYPQTLLSLGSSLNYHYLEEVLSPASLPSDDRRELADKVSESRARQIFREAGYSFVAFETGYATSVRDADIYYPYRGPQDQGQPLFLSMNSFEGLLFEKTIAAPLIDFGLFPQILADTMEAPYLRHGGRILFVFQKLAEMPDMDGDYFVFAHVIAPHPPFVFGENGEFIRHTTALNLADATKYPGTREEYIRNYTAQVTYLNGLVLRTVRTILSESETPPIIIIQGDHGPGAYLDWTSKENSNMRDRFSILNAYYLGGKESRLLYPSISPVNTFRVILNEYLGMDLELLPDRSYFSLWRTPYQFEEVTDEVIEK